MSAGGFGDAAVPTAELAELVASCRDGVTTFLQGAGWNGIITEFQAVSFKQQVCAPSRHPRRFSVLTAAHAKHRPRPHRLWRV